MARSFEVSILSPEQVLFKGSAEYVAIPGAAGRMVVLHDHAPLITPLIPGHFEIRTTVFPAPLTFKTTHPGMFEVGGNEVSILLDAEDTSVIDLEQNMPLS